MSDKKELHRVKHQDDEEFLLIDSVAEKLFGDFFNNIRVIKPNEVIKKQEDKNKQ